MFHRAHLVSDGRMEALRMKYGSTDYRNAVGVLRPVLVKAVNEDYLRPLSAFPHPVELVWGEADDEVPPVVAEIAVEKCARGHVEIVPGGGHLISQTMAEALRSVLLRCQPVAEQADQRGGYATATAFPRSPGRIVTDRSTSTRRIV